LDIDRVEFGAHQRARRTGLQAGRVGAVLAYVRHHQPALLLPAAIGLRLFDELDVPPGGGPQMTGVVVTVAGDGKSIGGQLVPLLAGNFAGLAANAEAGVSEEALRLLRWQRLLQIHQALVAVDHRKRPFRRLQVSALSSWM